MSGWNDSEDRKLLLACVFAAGVTTPNYQLVAAKLPGRTPEAVR